MQALFRWGCAHIASLQIIQKATRGIAEFVQVLGGKITSVYGWNVVFELDFAESVVGVREHLKYRLESFEAAVKAAASPTQARNVMP